MDRPVISLVALRCRTADRSSNTAGGVEALAVELGERANVAAREVGSPEPPRDADWREDLRDSRGCLLEAGGQVDDALAAGDLPVLLAGDCSVAATTLPAVVRHHPEARVLWLDAHADFNTPETSPSGYLGGMGLAAACGRWDGGLGDSGPRLDPSRITLCGVRDLDPGERVALELAGVPGVARLSEVADLVRDAPVFVHLDLDVLDPSVMPAHFPASLGLSLAGLHSVLLEVAAAATPVGIEITGFEAPEDAEDRMLMAALITDAVEPLLAGARQEA